MAPQLSADDLRPDLAIIGGGIAGGSLATAAARGGLHVLLLEKTQEHQDRVRGEYMPPWGVAEARDLGVLDVFEAAGANYIKLSVPYGEDWGADVARTRRIPMNAVVPNVSGAVCFGHPQVCTALNDFARAAGAKMIRCVSNVQVQPGAEPSVTFHYAGREITVRPRLVVGADGRGSAVARQLRLPVNNNGSHHLLCGLLVDGVPKWPADEMSIGTAGDIAFYVFPQGGGRVRLYAGYAHEQRGRFTGAGAEQRFLEAMRLECLPHSDALARAHPAGPCKGYPAGDTWIDTPGSAGVVLIGDAAGHNCPTTGQGVSIALRDARLVLQAFRSKNPWSQQELEEYAKERRERMRRLRFAAELVSTLRMEFGPEAMQRRQRAMARIAADPDLRMPLVSMHAGPFAVPAEAFTEETRARLLS